MSIDHVEQRKARIQELLGEVERQARDDFRQVGNSSPDEVNLAVQMTVLLEQRLARVYLATEQARIDASRGQGLSEHDALQAVVQRLCAVLASATVMRTRVKFAAPNQEMVENITAEVANAERGSELAHAEKSATALADALDEVLRDITANGAKVEDLDELVHDEASRVAAEVNNQGIDAQVAFLVQHRGRGETAGLLRDLMAESKANARRRAP